MKIKQNDVELVLRNVLSSVGQLPVYYNTKDKIFKKIIKEIDPLINKLNALSNDELDYEKETSLSKSSIYYPEYLQICKGDRMLRGSYLASYHSMIIALINSRKELDFFRIWHGLSINHEENEDKIYEILKEYWQNNSEISMSDINTISKRIEEMK